MPLDIPSVAEESAAIIAEIESETSDTIPAVSAIATLASALAGLVVGAYHFAGRLWLDMFAAHASSEPRTLLGRTLIPLEELGVQEGVGVRSPGVAAVLSLAVTTTATGGELPIGATLTATNGVTYTSTQAVTLDAATVYVPVIAGTKGAVGNLADGATITFVAPYADVVRDAVVDSTTVAGSDAETWGAYRRRVQQARATPPLGGSYSDYRRWATSVAGIEAAFPGTSVSTPGIVTTYVRATEASSGSADNIPTAGQLTAVENAIAAALPATHGYIVEPITRTAINVTIAGLTITTTSDAGAAIEAAVDAWLRSREPFTPGVSGLPRKDLVTATAAGGVAAQAAAAFGGTLTSLSLSTGASTALTAGAHVKAGTFTYTS